MPQPEFDPWTVQTVAIRYTDWAIPTHNKLSNQKLVIEIQTQLHVFGVVNLAKTYS